MKSTWLSRYIVARPWLLRWARPLAEWYHTKMGYRQLGLRYEDLLMEESEVVQLALKRLPPREAYDRVFRIRRAFQLTLTHQILPEEEWTPVEEDGAYLSPLIEEIEAELKEREDLESMVVNKKKKQTS